MHEIIFRSNPKRGGSALLAGLALFLAVPEAAAQLDLPRRKTAEEAPAPAPATAPKREAPEQSEPAPSTGRTGRSIVPHLVCAVCGERNYTSARNRPAQAGFFEAWCWICRRDTLHSPYVPGSGDLDLPQVRGQPAARGESAGDPPAPERPGAPSATEGPGAQRGAAAFIFAQLEDVANLDAPLLEKAVESLLAMGADGIHASRVALHEESPASVLTAARVLLRGGGTEDALRVVGRLRGRLPDPLGAHMLRELIERDPVHGSPALLVELLDHPQARVRGAAHKELRARLSPKLLPHLRAALASKRVETRLEAVRLIAAIDDPGVFDLFLVSLSDSSARVASEAVSAIAAMDDPRVELELEARAFSSRWILRENAYALLAIVEREDLLLRPILDERHAEPLLRALEMSDPFLFGASSAALAGIGFRASRPEETGWLDREVTGRLVAVVTGREFHSDFSALQPRARRRLELITGESFGNDGPAWARWWVESRDGFYARRVRISIDGERARRLELHYRGTDEDAPLFTLLGPGADEQGARARTGAGELYRITDLECLDLAALLEREGVLGPERLPGHRGEKSPRARRIAVLVDGRGKSFAFGEGTAEPWFERVAAAVRDVRDRNRWQRFPDLVAHEGEREFWEAEAPWWAAEQNERERARRLRDLVLKAAPRLSPPQRNVAVCELERLYAFEGVAALEDFRPFVELLRDEGFYADRARRLVALAVKAARSGAEREEPALPPELGSRLVDLLTARFGLEAAEDLAEIALASGRELARGLASDARPVARAVAAAALGQALARASSSGEDAAEASEDQAALLELLEDRDPLVESAACLALGRARIEAARTDLLVRARMGEGIVRAASLRALGELGGEYVLEALVLGTNALDAEVRRAAAEGLAALKDARSAPVLVSLLGHGRDSEVFEPARRGLLALGEEALPELGRVASSLVHRARREATLLLSYRGVPRAAGALIGLFGENPRDELVAAELAVLTCVDFSADPNAAERWDRWWDEVVRDDSSAWLRAAMERRGVEAPGPEALRGRGNREGALFLLEVAARPEPFLAERGRRDLERMLGRELAAPPHGSAQHAAWLAALRKKVTEHWDS